MLGVKRPDRTIKTVHDRSIGVSSRPVARVRLSGLYLALFWSVAPAIGRPERFDFEIRAEPMAAALVDLAIQARISIGHAGVDFREVAANPVHGRLTTEQALNALLANTGFEATTIDAQTVAIHKLTVAAPAPDTTGIIQEIVVTATKRTAVAQTLPDSIAVLTASDLEDRGATVSNDLTGQVAALTATNLGAGQDKLFIRGLSDSVFTGRTQSTVGLYLDDARVTEDAPDPGLRLVDVDQVEVLRGPQGTLYGAGTLGGLIRIVTNKSVLDRFEGMAAVSAATTDGGGPSGSADAMFNAPIVPDVLGLRLVGYIKSDGGYLDDPRLGLNNVNHTDTRGVRGGVTWVPADEWTVRLAVTDQTINAADAQYYAATLPPLTRDNLVQEPHQDDFLQTSVTIEGPLAWGTLTSATAYTRRRIADQYDSSLEWPVLTGYPAGRSVFDDVRDIRSATHETRLASAEADPWRWVTGLFLSTRDEDYRSRLTGPAPGNPGLVALGQSREDHANEAAIYGDLTYRPLDGLSLEAGVRLFYASVDAAATLDQIGHAPAPASGTNDATGITPKATLSFQPNDRMTLYVDAAEGFRLGGININGPAGATNGSSGESDNGISTNTFASDQLWSYEIGAKTSFLDGRLIANGAAYYTSWQNAQSDQILPDGTLYIANVGDGGIPGVEADLDFQATEHFRLRSNVFWSDPRIVHANPLLVQTAGRLPGVPEDSFGVSARYDRPIGDAYDAFADIDYAYVGKSYVGFDESNSPQMGNYYISNLRLGLLHDAWQATLYIDNISDERANSFAYGNPFSFGRVGQITPLRPRTIGLGISRSF
jgi:outer membrane receptor protein involved in Fe transport